ncbi:hypothetical protein BJ165DRAFT_1400655 [Panaeolus papilionaceus]|nr:hypothetical protein BJ165DRAFT_1400655 [Panaeolus papilionaceus]
MTKILSEIKTRELGLIPRLGFVQIRSAFRLFPGTSNPLTAHDVLGLPVSRFKNPLHFLHAFRDAVSGHQQLWNLGMLHRHVSVDSILLGKDGASEGDRGVLVDLDIATLNEEAKAHRTGARTFQSYMMFSKSERDLVQFPHDHLDDLESFLWLFVWITLHYEIHGTGDDTKVQGTSSHGRIFKFFDVFEQETDRAAANMKYSTLSLPAFPELAFGCPFYDLVDNLLGFLKRKVDVKHALRMRAAQAKSTGRPLPAIPSWITDDKPLAALKEQAADDYKVFLGHIDKAILDYKIFLDNLPPTAASTNSGSHNSETVTDR